MLHLARKAFYPSPPPFPLLHVDTTWKFRAMYELRDRMAAESGMDLIVYQNPEAKARGINPFDHGPLHTDMWKTEGLKQRSEEHTSELQSLMRISYAVFCLKTKIQLRLQNNLIIYSKQYEYDNHKKNMKL